jgi:hypothetical protein
MLRRITLTGIRVSVMLAMMDRRVDYDSFPPVNVHFTAQLKLAYR